MKMTSSEKIIRAINHQAGPVPVDFGATAVTGIHVSCVAALQRHSGLGDAPVKVSDPYQMLGLIEDDLLDALGADVVGVGGSRTMFGFPNRNWREWKTPWGQVVLVAEGFQTRMDAGGDLYIYPEGDLSVEPSGHMPRGGYFFDAIIRQQPIDEEALRAEDNCEEFVVWGDDEIAHWKCELANVAKGARAVLVNMPGSAFGDIAIVPATGMKRPRGIRDITEWYVSLVDRRDFVHAVFEHQCAVALKNLEVLARIGGDAIDVVYTCGTDFGTQSSQFCSAATFDELYAPYYRRLNDWVHSNTRWKTMKHSCGAVAPLIPNFIEAGFDILNPVQCSAAGMEPGRLKAEFGRDIVFWGGGVDTQKTLPFGSAAQVREEVLGRLRVFAPGGGFVCNAIHNVQALTPVENVVAMVEAVREYNATGGG